LERILVFDPSFISKAGKHTYGVGYFWSGCAQSMKRGLEIAGIAVVDVLNHTAFHYYAQQTCLNEGEGLLDYYARLIKGQATHLKIFSKYLVVDAYFAKSSFLSAMSPTGLHLLTRLRNDAVLRYPYLGPARKGKGRPAQYAGKMKAKDPDLQYFRPCLQEPDFIAYEACLHAKAFKCWLKVVLVHYLDQGGKLKRYQLLACSDTSLAGSDLWLYYHLRFQIEFLYRDAKQFLGLNHCQSRQKKRLHFQFNFALTLLSLVKIVHWLSQPRTQRKPFSMQNIKIHYTNQQLLLRFINGFGISPQTAINNPNYQELLDYAKIAA
jgi:hypothetical protein